MFDPRRRSKNGFSLAEMVVVLAIIITTVVVVIPMYNRYSARQSLRTATNVFASMLQRTQSVARATGTPSTGGLHNLPGYPNSLVSINASGVAESSYALPPGIAIAATPTLTPVPFAGCSGAAAVQLPNTAGLIFGTQGAPLPCLGGTFAPVTTIVFTLSDTRGNQLTVSIDTRTGMVTSI